MATATRARTCVGCGTTDAVAAYNLCRACDDAELTESCTESGVPFLVADGPTLDRVAVLLSVPAVASPASATSSTPALVGAGHGAAEVTADGVTGIAASSREAPSRSNPEKSETRGRSTASRVS